MAKQIITTLIPPNVGDLILYDNSVKEKIDFFKAEFIDTIIKELSSYLPSTKDNPSRFYVHKNFEDSYSKTGNLVIYASGLLNYDTLVTILKKIYDIDEIQPTIISKQFTDSSLIETHRDVDFYIGGFTLSYIPEDIESRGNLQPPFDNKTYYH